MSTELIVNGSFEDGSASWIISDLSDPFFPEVVAGIGLSPGFDLFATNPTDGNFVLENGFDGGGPGTISVAQKVVVPTGASRLTLDFDYRAGWDMVNYLWPTNPIARVFRVDIQSDGAIDAVAIQSTTYLTAEPNTTVLDTENQHGTMDLSGYAGQTIFINFEWYVPEFYTGPAHFQLDNVKLYIANNLPTGIVSINNTAPKQGQTLTASNTLADIDGLGAITYQWKTGTTVLSTGKTYIVTAAEVGKTISVTASYKDGVGNLESVDSAATAAVIAVAGVTFYGDKNGIAKPDSYIGGTGDDQLYGFLLNDTLKGGAGKDVLDGGDGNDFLDGGTDADTMKGGQGSDVYVVDNTGDVIKEDVNTLSDMLGSIKDTVQSALPSYTLLDNLENLVLINKSINGKGNNLGNDITGNDMANTLTGLDGGDVLIGGLGNDKLDGGNDIDIARYQGISTDYKLDYQNGSFKVTDNNIANGNDGIDTLISIETLQFSDKTIDTSVFNTKINTIFTAKGYYSTFADLSKAAYHLAPEEQLHAGQDGYSNGSVVHGDGQNYIKPYTEKAWSQVNTDWHVLTPNDLGGDTSGYYLWESFLGAVKITDDSIIHLSAKLIEPFYIGKFDWDETTWYLEKDGVYHGNNAAAFAVRSNDAVVISFRGTNDNDADKLSYADEVDWFNMDEHYGELLAFVNKIDDYVSANNIKKVYVTGHSLGGAMVEAYMLHHPKIEGSTINYEAVTFAAPGYNISGSLDPRIVSIEMDGDLVPDTGYHEGRIVTVNSPLYHNKDLTDYSTTDYHSMDIYMEAAHAIDAELPNTYINTASSVHGFDLNKFSSLSDGLIITMAMKESDGSEQYTYGNHDIAPQYVAMADNDVINDLGTYQSVEPTAYFLGGQGNDFIGNVITDKLPAGAIMRGGIGDDNYYVDSAFDKVIEKTDAGTDSVNSSISYTLPDNVEILSLMGTDKINGTGNNLINSLTGNAVANVLNGGIGTDIMRGGTGNDTYFVDNIGDEVHETSILMTEIDTVNSSVDYTLPANVENLTLTGSAINGFGNDSRNTLKGNVEANQLSGGIGADKLIGGLGSDTLTGGVGSDTFILNSIDDSSINGLPDVITDFKNGADKIDLSAIDANTTTPNNDPFFTLTELSSFSGTFDSQNALFFDKTTHKLYGDSNGDLKPDFSILLSGVTTLMDSDNIVF
jgi:Ca2+-binding RTX toxin-like protein